MKRTKEGVEMWALADAVKICTDERAALTLLFAQEVLLRLQWQQRPMLRGE